MNQILTYSFSARSVRALVLGLMLSTVFSVFGQTNIPAPYTTAGTFTWTPNFTGSVKVECWGGGGGGAGTASFGTGTNYRVGGGGGGGSYAVRTISVANGTTYNITVGVGGTGGAAVTTAFGTPGGFSSFSGGSVTETKASGGTPGAGGNQAASQNFGIGGVLGGVYGYTVSGTGTAYVAGSVSVSGGGGTGATASALTTTGNITGIYPTVMGTGYTSATVTLNTGSGQTATASVNPDVDATDTGGAKGGSGTKGSAATSASPTSGVVTVTAATPNTPTGQTTLTITANANITTSSLIYGSALSISAGGASVVSNSGTTLIINEVIPTPTAGTKTVYYHNSNVTSGAGGGGANGGGAGGAANTNSPTTSAIAGSAGTAPGGGGGGAISNSVTARTGGAGAAGQVTISLISLGVELAQFDAKANQKTTSLTWKTASEKDNAHFNIEQSTNGKDFQTVGQVKGNGTTSGSNSYTYEHSNPSVGVNYYRLKQEDFNGTVSYSPIKSVTFGLGKTGLVVKNTLSKDEIIVIVGEETATTVNIVNIAGQQVFTAKAQGEQRLNVSALPAGVYIISAANAVTRFVKQ
jgi:hypothetical protein